MDSFAKKVVHLVGTASGWGGLERAAVEVVTEQARRGMDVVLVASRDVCDRLPDGVVGVTFDFSASRRSPLMIWRLRQAVKQLRPEILHLHANKAAAIGKCLRFFLPGVKTVATIQNTNFGFDIYLYNDQLTDTTDSITLGTGARAGTFEGIAFIG